MKAELVLETDRFDNEAFEWSYIVYSTAPAHDRFDDVTTEHLQGQAYYRAGDAGVPAGDAGDARAEMSDCLPLLYSLVLTRYGTLYLTG